MLNSPLQHARKMNDLRLAQAKGNYFVKRNSGRSEKVKEAVRNASPL
jgi:hypothetical protein